MVTAFPVLWFVFCNQIQNIKIIHLKQSFLFYYYCHYIKLSLKSKSFLFKPAYPSQFCAIISSTAQFCFAIILVLILSEHYEKHLLMTLLCHLGCSGFMDRSSTSQKTLISSEQSFARKRLHHLGSGLSLRNLRPFQEASCKYTQVIVTVTGSK